MIISDFQPENEQRRNVYEPGTRGFNIPEKPSLFIIRTKDFPETELQYFWSLLIPWERAKSQRFMLKTDQESYVVLHGLLRSMLGKWLGMSPDSVTFRYNQYGKPYVSGSGPKIFFNMSHSAELSVLGFDPVSEIGVDIENINPKVDYESIVRYFFTASEISYVHAGNGTSIRRFYEIWTRKEALLKALGTGITENLRVDVSGMTPPKLKHTFNGEHTVGTFNLKTLSFRENYILSIASVETPGMMYIYHSWK